MVTMVMRALRKQADSLGGTIWNLSPFSQIRKFDPITEPLPTSTSAATDSSEPLEPSAS